MSLAINLLAVVGFLTLLWYVIWALMLGLVFKRSNMPAAGLQAMLWPYFAWLFTYDRAEELMLQVIKFDRFRHRSVVRFH